LKSSAIIRASWPGASHLLSADRVDRTVELEQQAVAGRF